MAPLLHRAAITNATINDVTRIIREHRTSQLIPGEYFMKFASFQPVCLCSTCSCPYQSSHSVNSPLSPSITPSFFHFRLKTYLFHKSFPSSLMSDSTDFTTGPFLLSISVFTARPNARIASAVLATAIPCVCLSVCLSHAGIVSKRRHVSWCSLHCQIAKCI